MRRAVLALTILAAVLVPLTAAPIRDSLPEPSPQVESQRVHIPVEIVIAPPPEPEDRIDLARELFRLTNESRVAAGIKPLRWWRDAVQPAAKAQTDRMVEADKIFHNPGLDALLYTLKAQTIAENVGMGPSISALHRAFMKSKNHRENILDPTLTLGAVWAVKEVHGIIVVTVVFGRPAATKRSP